MASDDMNLLTMELDVNLAKEEDQSWGFCLIGGVDFKMPLTVVKVLPDSSADKAGLQNGDTVARINDTIASDLSHDEARLIVDSAKTKITLGIQRGLYDPVLDEYEPIYEPIDQDGFDQPSQPTEVLDTFQIQQFLDPQSNICEAPKELKTDIYDLSERSLTASPFIPQTKPYRPFSTDPLDIPPLEDPIILNSNYHDEFKKTVQDDVDYEVLGLGSSLNDELKFKLPISQQYDPEWQKKESLSVEKKITKTESRKIESEIDKFDFKQKKEEVKQDKESMKKMKQEIDLDKIEMTANSIVDDSIVKAMSVAEEIKKEIDVELHEVSVTTSEFKELKTIGEVTDVSSTMSLMASELKSENVQLSSEIKVSDSCDEPSIVISEDVKINEIAKNYELTSQQKISITEAKSTTEIEKIERLDEQIIDERSSSNKKGVAEVIEKGNVRKKSIIFDQEKVTSDKKKEFQNLTTVEDVTEKLQTTMDHNENDTRQKNVRQVEAKKTAETKNTKARTTYKTEAEQKSYMIGLQTIPNIRGTLHSSCHYNLLLKTFFIHLTDVMVALSRFILSEPVFSKSEGSTEVKQEFISKNEKSESVNSHETNIDNEIVAENVENKVARTYTEHTAIEEHKNKIIQNETIKETAFGYNDIGTKEDIKTEVKSEIKIQEKVLQKKDTEEAATKVVNHEIKEMATNNYDDNFTIPHKRPLSGLEMAQLSEKKSEELTGKMDAVISEFESKTGIEETLEVKERRRRSRSRSQVQEQMINENDRLDRLSKTESLASQEITELKTSKKEFSNIVESAARKKTEQEDILETITTMPAGKQMYVAIVESHVFTNKDAIFDEHTTDISESAISVESAKSVNIATESNEAMSSENVTIKRSEIKEEKSEAVVEESHVVATKHETNIQQIEDVNEEANERTHFERATEIDTKSTQEAVIQQIIEPIIDIQELIELDLREDIQKVSVKEESFEVAKKECAQIKEIVNKSSINEYDAVDIRDAHVEFTSTKEEMYLEKATKVDIKSTQEVVAHKIIEPVIEVHVEVDMCKDIEEVSDKGSDKVQDIIHEISEDKYDAFEVTESNVELTSLKEHEIKLMEDEKSMDLDVTAQIKIDKPLLIDTEPKNESIALKIVKEEVIEIQPSPEILESEQTKVLKIEEAVDLSECLIAESISKFVDISESNSLDSFTDVQNKTIAQESSFTAKCTVQESSFTAQLVTQESSFTAKSKEKSDVKNLTLRTDLVQEKTLDRQSSAQSDENNNLGTPTPTTTVPPTPVTDEYVFKLLIPLPKNIAPVPRDPSPEIDEDPHIVKKKLVPHIETTLESPIIYDPPLPTPPVDKIQSPVYTKPGLKGGAERVYIKEEILEIGRKSSLLASAIDETIKSIEEYKEQVGMEINKEVRNSKMEYSAMKTEQNFSIKESTAELKQTYVSNSKIEVEDEWSKVNEQVAENNKCLAEISRTAVENERDSEVSSAAINIDETVSESIVKISEMKDRELNDSKKRSVDIKELNNELEPEININYKSEISEQPTEERVEVSKMQNIKKVSIALEPETKVDSKIDISERVESLKPSRKSNENISEYNQAVSYINGNSDIGNMYTENMNNSVMKLEELEQNVSERDIKTDDTTVTEEKVDPMLGYRPVKFNPEEFAKYPRPQVVEVSIQGEKAGRAYMTTTGQLIGTVQGIVDGLEEATVDEDIAKELGKPGMTEEKIAELISGESEMLREAHVMGLTRVLTSHMTRSTDDSSVDFKKIKPIIESLKDSAVLKALNDDLTKTIEEKKKEERKWTTFLQKPKRPVPKVKFGYYGYVDQEEEVIETPYKVKIVKQPKPKVAPDYKPENFDTGPLPWEERALNEPPPAPIEAEEPILVPEELPEFIEAVDPLPESEVPDLEETGITLPAPEPVQEITEEPSATVDVVEEPVEETEEIKEQENLEPEETQTEDMENRIAEQLMSSVQNMVDPNATLEQQLSQMRAQLAALAQLPEVIQQTLQMVTKQLSQLQQESVTIEASQQSSHQESSIQQIEYSEMNGQEEVMVTHNTEPIVEESEDVEKEAEVSAANDVTIEEQVETTNLSQEEMEKLKKEEAEMLEEQRRIEKQKKDMMDQMKQDQESRQLKQRPTPRVGKPKPVFGPPNPEDRPLVLSGGRKWRGPKDVYDEQMLTETLKAQAELIQGKTLGASFESVHLPFDERINFMKYEKPPVSLDHLQHSEVYKMIHNMEQAPVKRVEMLTPVIAEADYREKCRSISPCVGRMAKEQHMDIPQQLQP